MVPTAPKSPAGDDRNLITIDENYLAPSFEDRLQIFWEKNSRTVVTVLVVVVVAIVAKGAFSYLAAQRERAIAAEYAAAATTAQLQAFAQAHPAAPLAGAAHLRLADEAYAAGSYATAKVDYAAASKLLGSDPLATRARLGAAVSLLQAGDASATVALQELANDTTLPGPVRAETAYHLAVLARDAGQSAEAARWTDLVLSNESSGRNEPPGFWSQRAVQLRAALPPAATPEAAAAAPTVSFPAAPASP